MKPLLQAMKERRLYLDGGMGSMLQAAGLPEGLLPDVWGMQNPAAVQGVHRAYLEAGARLITTNTFGTSAPKLAPYGVTVDEVMAAAVANVRQIMVRNRPATGSGMATAIAVLMAFAGSAPPLRPLAIRIAEATEASAASGATAAPMFAQPRAIIWS